MVHIAVLLLGVALAPAEPAADGPEPADLTALLAKVDRARLERDVRKLAGFGTRHPLSSRDDPAHGVGAARRWLLGEFEAAVAAANAAAPKDRPPPASVRVQAFDQRMARGNATVAHFENFLFEFAGSDAARGVWIVGGHYDSRCKDEND